QFSLSASLAESVRSPLVIPGVPVQPESVPVTLMSCASLTVGATGGDNVSFPVKVVQANALFNVPGDEADVLDPAPAALLAEALRGRLSMGPSSPKYWPTPTTAKTSSPPSARFR